MLIVGPSLATQVWFTSVGVKAYVMAQLSDIKPCAVRSCYFCVRTQTTRMHSG
jgi:hypothetical protein